MSVTYGSQDGKEGYSCFLVLTRNHPTLSPGLLPRYPTLAALVLPLRFVLMVTIVTPFWNLPVYKTREGLLSPPAGG